MSDPNPSDPNRTQRMVEQMVSGDQVEQPRDFNEELATDLGRQDEQKTLRTGWLESDTDSNAEQVVKSRTDDRIPGAEPETSRDAREATERPVTEQER